jgi:hypothetical protein
MSLGSDQGRTACWGAAIRRGDETMIVNNKAAAHRFRSQDWFADPERSDFPLGTCRLAELSRVTDCTLISIYDSSDGTDLSPAELVIIYSLGGCAHDFGFTPLRADGIGQQVCV